MTSLFNHLVDHHAAIASIGGVAIASFGLWLLTWRTLIASRQLDTSNRIAESANRSRLDSILANGANMLGEDAAETKWAGINTLISLVDDSPEYMERVITSFCASLRTARASDEQKRHILDAINRWLKTDDWKGDTGLDLRGLKLTEFRLNDVCLSGAKLSDSEVGLVYARNVDFTNADFSRNRTRFGCRLSYLMNCDFTGATLTDVDLSGVNLTGSRFAGADISGMRIGNAPRFEGMKPADYPEVPIETAVVTKAQLEEANWADGNRPVIDIGVRDADTGEQLRLRGHVEKLMDSLPGSKSPKPR